MGPGLSAITGGEDVTKVAGWKIIREMLKHVWPRDQPVLKARVVVALGLLVGAKVCSCVSIIFHDPVNPRDIELVLTFDLYIKEWCE